MYQIEHKYRRKMSLTPLYLTLYLFIIRFLLQNGLWDEFLSSMNNELLWGNIHLHIKVIVHYTIQADQKVLNQGNLKKYPNFVLNFRVVRFKSLIYINNFLGKILNKRKKIGQNMPKQWVFGIIFSQNTPTLSIQRCIFLPEDLLFELEEN